jgi:hypothetical protein
MAIMIRADLTNTTFAIPNPPATKPMGRHNGIVRKHREEDPDIGGITRSNTARVVGPRVLIEEIAVGDTLEEEEGKRQHD